MKSAIALSLFLCLIIVGCSKDKNNDTPSETPKTNKEMLTAKTWQVAETYQNISGTRTHYLRGGENTTGVNIGATRLKFNADGTGTTTDVSGDTFNLTWSFSTPDERSLEIVVNNTIHYNWIFTHISEDFIIQTSLVSSNGLLTSTLVPAP